MKKLYILCNDKENNIVVKYEIILIWKNFNSEGASC